MQTRPYTYLFKVSYFGARYKGWAIQKGQPTVQGKLERVFRFVLGNDDFTILGGSRTDSGVSCRHGYFQFFSTEAIDWTVYLASLNENLAGEIQLIEVREINREFNLIEQIEAKTYRYYFSTGSTHSFATAYMATLFAESDIEKMKDAASLFRGEYDFRAFCTPSVNKSNYRREVISCRISVANDFQGEFFPKNQWMMEIKGKGFLHHQVRKIMRAIWYMGLGEWKREDITQRLENPTQDWEKIPAAPAHGLILWETILKTD